MTTKFRFTAITYEGKKTTRTIKFNTPNFEDEEFEFMGYELTSTKESKLMDWMDNQDKKDLMEQKEWQIILDYEVVTPKHKKTFDLVSYFRGKFEEDPQFKADFMVTLLAMKESLKGLSQEKKMLIVMKAMGVGYRAASTAYEKTIGTLKTSLETKKITK